MNETLPVLQRLQQIVADPHFWLLAFSYWIFSAAVGALEAPDATSGKLYRWAFKFLNILASNITRAFSSRIPGLNPPNGGK